MYLVDQLNKKKLFFFTFFCESPKSCCLEKKKGGRRPCFYFIRNEMATRRNGFIESLMKLKQEKSKENASPSKNQEANEVLPCTFRAGNDTTDIAPAIRKAMGACILAYDFTEACNWPLTRRIGFTRRRLEGVSSGMPLFEIQAATRQLQADLENERASFCAMMNQLDHCVRQSPYAVEVLGDFLAAFARTIGKGIEDLMDWRREGHSNFPFNQLDSLWHMSEFAKQIVDDMETIFGDAACMDYEFGIETLNQCIVWLCILGFLSSYHYSAMRRTRFVTIFNSFFILAQVLSKKEVHPNLAGYIYAAAQTNSAKRQSVLKKCASSTDATSETKPIDMVPLVSFQLKIGILRVVRRQRSASHGVGGQQSELSCYFGDVSDSMVNEGTTDCVNDETLDDEDNNDDGDDNQYSNDSANDMTSTSSYESDESFSNGQDEAEM